MRYLNQMLHLLPLERGLAALRIVDQAGVILIVIEHASDTQDTVHVLSRQKIF